VSILEEEEFCMIGLGGDSISLPTASDEDEALGNALQTALAPAHTNADLVFSLVADRPYLERKMAALLKPCLRPLIGAYLLRAVGQCTSSTASAARRLLSVSAVPKATSGTDGLDALLCGGAARGQITEIVGAAGVGKTQLVLQMLVCSAASQHPAFLFATEPFPAQRLSQLAQERARRSSPSVTASEILSRIFVIKIATVEQLRKAISNPFFVDAVDSGPSLVALDSIAALGERETDGRISEAIGAALALHNLLAARPGVACVITNQVRASFTQVRDLPALGLSWAQLVHTRMQVQRRRDSGQRQVSLVSSPHLPPGQCLFEIESCGIVDAA
jgi:RecA/RadA recombinase